ncbi:MAG: TetR/AcrR family transcriptional regulator [Solirubrobacteraceae bacterium]|nr:TetR/AcrR family transcriptional regulator [Solirubrobacteraceae bacterium]
MSTPTDEQPLGRRERRKLETRAKLVAAARSLIAGQGVDAVRINEITDEADVGFGSFYNHFESKEAIVAAVVEAVASELGDAIDAATSDLDDAAEVMAVAHRTIIDRAAAEPTLGWLLVRLELSHDVVSTALGPYALRDLQRGIAAGRFHVDDQAATLIALGGALLGAVRAVLLGRVGDDPAITHAALALQLLGLPAGEAQEVARRPLPRG